MGRDALRAVTSADVAALLPGGGGAGTRVFTAVCVAPGGDRFYLGDDDGDIIACRVVRGADADGIVGASVRVDAVANIADDDILNHAPFEDSDDEDSVAGSCAQLSPRVMRLEYMASLNCVIAMTPRRGLTVHHLGLIDPHGRAPIERMRSGRIEDAPDLRRGVSSRTKKTSEKHPILRHHRRDRRVGIEPTTHRTHQTARRRSSRRGVRPHAHAPGHRAPGDATRVARRGEHTTRRHGSMVLRRKYKNGRRSSRRSAG
jgi:hypothetical protein